MYKSKWMSADQTSPSNVAPADLAYYNMVRRKRALPVDAPYSNLGISNSTLKIANSSTRSDYERGLRGESLKKVSDERRDYLMNVLSQTTPAVMAQELHPQLIRRSDYDGRFVKQAVSGTQGLAHSTNTTHLAPDFYSPLWLGLNMQMPRDIRTANAWNRAYYETNPYVRNAINLHATYPISKLKIKCEDKKVEKFFLDMMDRIDLDTVVQQVSLEYWKMGEAFVYADFDAKRGEWAKVYIHNPDYIMVKSSPIPGVSFIGLQPDPHLAKIITSNDPASIKIRESLDPRIIEHVRKNEFIPLDNFNISHLKNLSAPYDVRGTSIIVSVWKDLMLYDRIRESKLVQADGMINPMTHVKIGSSNPDGHYPTQSELETYRSVLECHDEETEVLTSEGFKRFNEVMTWTESISENGEVEVLDVIAKPGVEIACFNDQTEELEYHKPIRATLYQRNGEMCHFKNDNIDICVTPNHKMLYSRKYYAKDKDGTRCSHWGDWEVKDAEDVFNNPYGRFRSEIKWNGDDSITHIDVCGKPVEAELYLECLGYMLSERYIYSTDADHTTGTYQVVSKHMDKIAACVEKFANAIDEDYCAKTKLSLSESSKHIDAWSATFSGKRLAIWFADRIGDDKIQMCFRTKYVPREIMNLSPRLLTILLEALVDGDGSRYISEKGTKRWFYNSTSKRLADDVYEIAYKCGYVPTVFVNDSEKCFKDGSRNQLYTVAWSDNNGERYPSIYKTSIDSVTKERTYPLQRENYNGKVWCFEVPTGFFITRRNGKITVQHNSAQYDKDFKLITHDAVDIQRIGYNGAVMDTSADLQFIIDNVLMGLMVPKSILTQEGATYASASVALDVMRQRYNNFRTMMANWLEKKIFAPIAEVQGFYRPENGIKRLIVPTVEWNHMTLYDLDNYLQHVLGLIEKQHVSVETVYRSLGLNKEEELANVRAEQVRAAILRKENEELSKMTLSELRTLDPRKPVPERPRDVLPGQLSPSGGGGGMGDLGGMPPPMSGGDLGGMPPPMPGGDLGGMLGGADLGPGGPGGDLTAPPPMM
jgi:hypothetical protein